MRENGTLQFLIVAFLLMAVYVAHSQGSAPEIKPSLMPNTPIDGGIFLLLAIGLTYGAKVLYRKN
jgi:hypothetical protein